MTVTTVTEICTRFQYPQFRVLEPRTENAARGPDLDIRPGGERPLIFPYTSIFKVWISPRRCPRCLGEIGTEKIKGRPARPGPAGDGAQCRLFACPPAGAR